MGVGEGGSGMDTEYAGEQQAYEQPREESCCRHGELVGKWRSERCSTWHEGRMGYLHAVEVDWIVQVWA